MTIIDNYRKTKYNFFILDEYEAGLILKGQEVKSIRMGDVSLNDSFIFLKDGEVWLKNLNVTRYKSAHQAEPHDNNRDKKLLLNKREIIKIDKELSKKGISCVPIKIFTVKNKIKIKIAIVQGKKNWDKRTQIKERDIERDMKSSL